MLNQKDFEDIISIYDAWQELDNFQCRLIGLKLSPTNDNDSILGNFSHVFNLLCRNLSCYDASQDLEEAEWYQILNRREGVAERAEKLVNLQ